MKRLIAFVLCILSVSLLLSTSLFAAEADTEKYKTVFYKDVKYTQKATPPIKHKYLPLEDVTALQKRLVETRRTDDGRLLEWTYVEIENPVYYQRAIPEIKKNHLSFEQVLLLQEKLIKTKHFWVCKHESTLAYHDGDLGEYGELCLDCGLKLTGNQELAVKRIETSAELRRICQHEFDGWSPNNGFSHVHTCLLCGVQEYEAHNIVPANCTDDEHCDVCGEHLGTWEDAWGHDMQYVYSGDCISNHMHDYCCVRLDSDTNPICDYVESTESCNFTTYWDGESGGIHEIYDMCNQCYICGETAYTTCTMAELRDCYYCEYPNSWELP